MLRRDASRPLSALPVLLVLLAGSLSAVALLGPLGTGTIAYRYSPTMLNQARGLDAFALLVVVPWALLAALQCRRGSRVGPLLALAPAGFAAYMLVQYVVGPEYLARDGNAERAFPLFALTFSCSAAILALAWSRAVSPPVSDRQRRHRGVGLLLLAAFVLAGMYLANGFLSALTDFPEFVESRAGTTEYDEHPTAYWLVAFLDLAVVVPLTVATGVGLLRGRAWARTAFYGVVGWFALVPPSVAAMAVVMVARDDPAADSGKAVVFVVAGLVFLAAAARLFRGLADPRVWEEPSVPAPRVG